MEVVELICAHTISVPQVALLNVPIHDYPEGRKGVYPSHKSATKGSLSHPPTHTDNQTLYTEVTINIKIQEQIFTLKQCWNECLETRYFIVKWRNQGTGWRAEKHSMWITLCYRHTIFFWTRPIFHEKLYFQHSVYKMGEQNERLIQKKIELCKKTSDNCDGTPKNS